MTSRIHCADNGNKNPNNVAIDNMKTLVPMVSLFAFINHPAMNSMATNTNHHIYSWNIKMPHCSCLSFTHRATHYVISIMCVYFITSLFAFILCSHLADFFSLLHNHHNFLSNSFIIFSYYLSTTNILSCLLITFHQCYSRDCI